MFGTNLRLLQLRLEDMDAALKLLLQRAGKDSYVSAIITLAPSRAVALSEPDVRRYFGSKIVSKPLRFKIGKPEPLNFQPLDGNLLNGDF